MRLSGMLWKLITARVLAGLYLIVIPAEAGIQDYKMLLLVDFFVLTYNLFGRYRLYF